MRSRAVGITSSNDATKNNLGGRERRTGETRLLPPSHVAEVFTSYLVGGFIGYLVEYTAASDACGCKVIFLHAHSITPTRTPRPGDDAAMI